MSHGSIDLILLLFIFLVLQAWWIISIVKNHKKLTNSKNQLINKVKFLEEMYKK